MCGPKKCTLMNFNLSDKCNDRHQNRAWKLQFLFREMNSTKQILYKIKNAKNKYRSKWYKFQKS